MGSDTAIEWCDHTFNPWWGCQRVSPGCEHCYAEAFAKRVGFNNRSQPAGGQGPIRTPLPVIWGPGTPRRFFGDKHWDEPLKWNAEAQREGVRRRVFCASMADVFELRIDLEEPRERLFDLIARTEHLDWLILTKRPQNIARMIPWGPLGTHRADPKAWWNVWLGTTVEDQQRANERIPELLKVPAAIRFLSYEPALGLVELDRWVAICKHWPSSESLARPPWAPAWPRHWWKHQALVGAGYRCPIDWVIVGGESGPGARPFDSQWAGNMIAQCKAAGIACFVKQLGAKPYDGHAPLWVTTDEKIGPQSRNLPPSNSSVPLRTGELVSYARVTKGNELKLADRKGADPDQWPEDLRVRQFPDPVALHAQERGAFQ